MNIHVQFLCILAAEGHCIPAPPRPRRCTFNSSPMLSYVDHSPMPSTSLNRYRSPQLQN